jgi:imidazolonepropionase-like amidohydrolase
MPAWVIRKAESESGAHQAAFAAAVAAGVAIAAGTDAGTPYNPHHSLARELRLMVDYGMSPAQAIMAATINAARNLGIDHLVGTVEVGKRADLILVPGDPTEDIRRLEDTPFVMRDGRVIHDRLLRSMDLAGAGQG